MLKFLFLKLMLFWYKLLNKIVSLYKYDTSNVENQVIKSKNNRFLISFKYLLIITFKKIVQW